MTQYWPQLTYLALIIFSLGITTQQHGKPKTGNENVWVSLMGAAISVFLLYMGGFFNA